jgi:hypothetical protein
MPVNTSPNPIYIAQQQRRHGEVDHDAWLAAVQLAGSSSSPNDSAQARRAFDKVRRLYWIERVKRAVPLEFNHYNQALMRTGRAPYGPDGFSMELEHRQELSQHPALALDPANIWEIFRRQHDFQHGAYAFRWHPGSEPRGPHDANLPTWCGDPKQFAQWP